MNKWHFYNEKKIYLFFNNICISNFFNYFENTYIIYKYNHHLRLINNYGFCHETSYGFIKYLDKKFNFEKNIKIINDETHPSSDTFIHKLLYLIIKII